MTTMENAWQTLENLESAVTKPWLTALKSVFANLQLSQGRDGWWTADAHAQIEGCDATLRLAARPSDSKVVLRASVTGYLAPSVLFGELYFQGSSNPSALDFLGLEGPVLYVSNYDSSGQPFDPRGEGETQAVVEGLTLTGTIPDSSRLDAIPRALTRPLKYALEDTHALPAWLELTVASQAVTATLHALPPWTPKVPSGPLVMTLAKRQIGVTLERKGSGQVPTRSAPATNTATGEIQAPPRDTFSIQLDMDLCIDPAEAELPFPRKDTARMTLGALLRDGGDRVEADGWLRLRDEARPWTNPFGLPSTAIDALYGRVDLATRSIKAVHGEARLGGHEFEVGMILAAQRSEQLIALSNRDDLSLLSLGAALLEHQDRPKELGPVLVGQPQTFDPEAAIDPENYTLYVSAGTQQFDGKKWPPGLRLRGKVKFWSIAEAGVDLGVTWTENGVTMAGTGLAVKLGGIGCSVDLGGMLAGLPLRVTVTPALAVYVEADYRLRLGAFSVDGTLRLSSTGVSFDLPGNGGLWQRNPDIGLTGLSAPGGNLKQLKIAAFVSRSLEIPLPPNPLPAALEALPGGEVLSATGELHFSVDISTNADQVGASLTRLVGRIPALNLEQTLDLSGIDLDLGDLKATARAIDTTLRAWAERTIRELFADLFGQIPLAGPLLRNAFGFANEALGRMFAVADGVLDSGFAKDGLDSVLREAGVAVDAADQIVAGAMDWAHQNGLQTGVGVGKWAVDGLDKGLTNGLGAVTAGLSKIPGFSDTLGAVSGAVGGLFHKKRDDHPGAKLREKLSQKAADGKVALLFQQRELGGSSYPFPLGRYPRMPADLRPNDDGGGANSMVLPRGWTVEVWPGENFQGQPAFFDLTTNDMGDWVDHVRSIAVVRQAKAVFYTDNYYRDYAGQLYDGESATASGTSWLGDVSSIMVAENFVVEIENEARSKLTLTSSEKDLKWQYGSAWKDSLVRVTVRRTKALPAKWQSSSPLAWGQSSINDWTEYKLQAQLQVYIDLSSYGFQRPPRVFTTLAGDSTHNAAYGYIAPYNVTTKGFTAYVGLPGKPVPLSSAKKPWNWRLNWIAVSDDTPMTIQGSETNFSRYNEDPYSVMSVVKHSQARVDGVAAPAFTSLRGVSTNSFQTGAGSSYNVSERGLSVYLHGGLDRFTPSGALRERGTALDLARIHGDWKWQLDWCRPLFGSAGVRHRGTRLHSGRTAPGANWESYGPDGLSLRVDTLDLDLPADVVFITSLSGRSSLWTITGGSAVYESGPKGFRIYIRGVNGGRMTPTQARAGGWHIHWMAVGSG